MINRKIYIFVAHTITPIGGMESYTAGMSKYLESQGWLVYVLTPEPSNSQATIPSLQKYLAVGGDCTFLLKPPYRYKRYEQEMALNFMLEKLSISNPSACEIIVESCSGARTCWAELLAARLNARHIFIASEENYREDWQVYDEILPFMYFKLQRNEIIGRDEGVSRLFNGYKNVTKMFVEFPYMVREQDAVQDVAFQPVQLGDYNICHIGRHGKSYVRPSIKGVAEFARRHQNKSVHFFLIGDAEPLKPFLNEQFNGLENVKIFFLGILVPLPKKLLAKMDVIIALAQTATFAAYSGVLTLCGVNDHPDKTSGVLGYDTKERTFGEPKFTYVEALENVLVKKLYRGKKFKMEKLLPAEHYYKNLWTILKKVAPNKEYFTEYLQQERIRDWTAIFPFVAIARGTRIIFYGATDITKDYKRSIKLQENIPVEFGRDYIKQFKPAPYCEIIATVDENPDDFDNDVVGIERLKIIDYDVIVICTLPDKAQAAFEKITQTVPEMANKIVYNFQVNQV